LISHTSVKSQSEKFNPRQEEAEGFPIDPRNADGSKPPSNGNLADVRMKKENSRNAPSSASQPVHNRTQSAVLSNVLSRDSKCVGRRQGSIAAKGDGQRTACNDLENSQVHGPARRAQLNMVILLTNQLHPVLANTRRENKSLHNLCDLCITKESDDLKLSSLINIQERVILAD
jgi:hypothetical protein